MSSPIEPEPCATEASAEFPIFTEGLTRRFGDKAAVSDVSMRVPKGCTFGLIGLNGAGKSTTIRLLLGLLPPTSGRVVLRGLDVRTQRVSALNSVGYVPDRPEIYPWMRVHQAIAFCRALQPRWDNAYCDSLLKRFRIDSDQRVDKLSKGAAAKLSLLLALSHDPEVLILDEPTDGLDPVAKDDFLEGVLASVCEKRRTVLMSSHALADVQRMADWIGLMHDGRLEVQCPTDTLVSSTRRLNVVLADGAAAPARPAGAIHARQQGRVWSATVRGTGEQVADSLREQPGIRDVSVESLSLEEIFKDFVRGQEERS